MSRYALSREWAGLAATLVFVAASLGSGAYAMGISPGVYVVENVPLGQETAASSDAAPITVHNEENDQPLTVVLSVQRPSAGGLSNWELGYDEIPDASWCRLDKTELEVPAKGASSVKLFVKVPDKPENYNRRWMVAVVCGQKRSGQGGPAGFGIRLATRVGIETLPNADVDGKGDGAVVPIPSVLCYDGCIPGETFNPPAKIRNHDKVEHKFVVKRLEQVVQDEERIKRYFRRDATPLIKDSWIAPLESFAVKAGETKELKLSVTIPKDVAAGKIYEEIVFLKDDADRSGFIRLRMQIAGGKAK